MTANVPPAAGRRETDFTLMYVIHDALRRDLGHLRTAARAGAVTDPAVHAGWTTFKDQLHVHHTAEDASLWPRMRAKLADRSTDLALLEAMEAEHSQIGPLLDSIDTAFSDADVARLHEHAEGLATAVVGHLDHEENEALPLMESVLSPQDWAEFIDDMRRRQGLKGAAVFFPWLLDGVPAETRRGVLRALPPPVRLIYRFVWLPRYTRQQRWTATTA